MSKQLKPRFTPGFRLETVKLVIEHDYSIRETAEAMHVGKTIVDKCVRDYRKGQSTHNSLRPKTPLN